MLCGRISVSMTHCHIQVPYKYVVQLKEELHYERLIEFSGNDVDRCFKIPTEVVKNNGKNDFYRSRILRVENSKFNPIYSTPIELN